MANLKTLAAILASLVTMVASSEPSGFFWKELDLSINVTLDETNGYISGSFFHAYKSAATRNSDYTGTWVRLGSKDLMAGKVTFLRSNQGDRLDGNESVADSFRSDLVSFKSWFATILGAFFPLRSAGKNLQVLITRFEKAVPLSTRLQLFSSCIQGSSESVQEFAARINKLETQIFQSSNSAQNMQVRNANDQLLQTRFISGLRNDILRFVLARDPINFEESISAALIEEQSVKLNQIANDERTGLSPSQTETSVISALTNKLQEINLRVERLQEASSVTARKTGGDLFRRRRYIKNFTKRALPLTNLLRKDTPFEWTSETQEAFDDIKKAILNPPVLALPDPDAELQITTDASSRGIGAVLEQKYPNSEVKPLYFFQRN
ncbi:transposon Tf2-9 polyprotein [Trichonephila clavipes]|nr:transposon Tf2-9 polyprotein [Trichonephila clavipes]